MEKKIWQKISDGFNFGQEPLSETSEIKYRPKIKCFTTYKTVRFLFCRLFRLKIDPGSLNYLLSMSRNGWDQQMKQWKIKIHRAVKDTEKNEFIVSFNFKITSRKESCSYLFVHKLPMKISYLWLCVCWNKVCLVQNNCNVTFTTWHDVTGDMFFSGLPAVQPYVDFTAQMFFLNRRAWK